LAGKAVLIRKRRLKMQKEQDKVKTFAGNFYLKRCCGNLAALNGCIAGLYVESGMIFRSTCKGILLLVKVLLSYAPLRLGVKPFTQYRS
jgi:hypothetical protein